MTRDEIRRMLPLQAGGLLGPMAGTGLVTLVPSLAAVFGVTVGQIALAITVYMIPFAIVQFFTGALAHRLSASRTVELGFLLFIAASLGCAAAPTFPLFLLCRLLQGVGGAFLFPILMALVGDVVAPERLGRAIGIYGVTQTLGLTLGPLVAGLAEVHVGWRWFFVFVAASAVVSALGFLRLFGHEREVRPEASGVWATAIAALGQRSVVWLSLAGAGLFFSMVGTFTYLATWLKDVQALPEDRIGIVLGLSGAVGIPASALAGSWVDRVGRKPIALAGLAGYAGAIVGLGVVPYSFARVLGLVVLLGWFAATAWTALNTLVVELLPALRKPVASIYNAFRFTGYSLAPPLLGLVYGDGELTRVCLVCAVTAVASAACVLRLRPAPRDALGTSGTGRHTGPGGQ